MIKFSTQLGSRRFYELWSEQRNNPARDTTLYYVAVYGIINSWDYGKLIMSHLPHTKPP